MASKTDLDEVADVNVKNTYFLVKEAVPLLKAGRTSGSVLIIGSQPFDKIAITK